MKTLDEIRNTPVLFLTEAEIAMLDPESQAWAINAQMLHRREKECPGHEPVGRSSSAGWHSFKCKHCGKDMSWDSGD